MQITPIRVFVGLGVLAGTGYGIYKISEYLREQAPSDVVDSVYSAARVELPEDAGSYVALNESGKLTYDQFHGLHLNAKAQAEALKSLDTMIRMNGLSYEAATAALVEKLFPSVNWLGGQISAKQEKVLEDYLRLALVIESSADNEFIRVDVDPVGTVEGACEATVQALKTGVWDAETLTVKRPTESDPNVELRNFYANILAPNKGDQIPVESMKKHLGKMVMSHGRQTAAFNDLYRQWIDAYESGDAWSDPVSFIAEKEIPGCQWQLKETYTPDMVAAWEDLKRLNALAAEIAYRDHMKLAA